MTRIYISAPFRTYCTEMEGREYGVLDSDAYKRFLENVEGIIRSLGLEACLPHRDEGQWGNLYIPPHEITKVCFDLIRRSDALVVFPGKSRGVHIEMGYAAALGKKLVVLLAKDEKESTLLRGILCATDTKVYRYGAAEELAEILATEFASD